MNAPHRVLRAVEPGDMDGVADLWVAAWKSTVPPIDFTARRAWFVGRLGELANEGAAFLVGLDAEGRPAGLVTVDPKSGHVDQLCVAPSERGGGLARARQRGQAPRSRRRRPRVNVANLHARRFYEREGFLVVGVGTSPVSALPTLRLRWRAGEG